MLDSLARSCLWLFLRKGLLHLGEQYPVEAKPANTSNIGNEDDRHIMPMQLMLLYAVVALCMTVGILGFCAVSKSNPTSQVYTADEIKRPGSNASMSYLQELWYSPRTML